MADLSANNRRESCRDHHKSGLSGGQRCSIWNYKYQETQGLRCPPGGVINGVCDGNGAAACYAQHNDFKMAANCVGVDDSYFVGGYVDADKRGHCPDGTALVYMEAPGGWLKRGKGQCRKLIENAFDDSGDAATIRNTGPNWKGSTWTSGPVRSWEGAKLQFCPSNHVATKHKGVDMGCRLLRPTQESFIEMASKDHS